MVFRNAVRTLVSVLFLCAGVAVAQEERLTEEMIRELAAAYLEAPTIASKGSLAAFAPACQNSSCNSCGSYPCDCYILDNPPPVWSSPAPMNGATQMPPEMSGPMPSGYPNMMPNGMQPHPGMPPEGGVPPNGGVPPQAGVQNHPAPQQTNPIFPAGPPMPQPEGPRGFKKPDCGPAQEGYTINFDDISVIQLIQFISKISGTNFIFNSQDLQFNVTIVSEDPTSVSNLSSALLQVLKMHDLQVVEQGNNVLIYRNQTLSKLSTVITEDNVNDSCDAAIVTRVFPLEYLDPVKIARIVKTLLSPEAIVEPSVETGHLIVSDITANVNKIADLLSALDSTPAQKIATDIADYSVKNANPAVLAEYAHNILKSLAVGSVFDVIPETVSQKIFVVGTPFIIRKALQILESLDVPDIIALQPVLPPQSMENNSMYMYKLKYQSGLEIADALREIGTNLQYTGVANPEFVNTIFSIQWLEVNNSIIITGSDEAIKRVIAILNDLDQAPKQVYIEVLILDTSLQNSLDFGVQWVALGNEQGKLAFGSGLLANSVGSPTLAAGARNVAGAAAAPQTPPSTNNVPLTFPAQLSGTSIAGDISNLTEAFSLGFVGNIISHGGKSFLTLGALISALDEEQDATIVLNPKIMVEDTQPANFFVGQNIPYQTTSTVIQQTGSVTQNIQYEDIGVQLQVTPTIAPNNIVTLQINQTVASVVGGVTSNLTPTTSKELVSTRVHVPDGTFLVMSGHVFESCNYIRSGIPCLGTLPLIGPAFGRTIEQRQKRNLIFFIRPKVVTTIQEGICLTNQEGYDHNWESSPCSLRDGCCPRAPECEFYPAPPLCPIDSRVHPHKIQREDHNHRHDYYSDHNYEHEPDARVDASEIEFKSKQYHNPHLRGSINQNPLTTENGGGAGSHYLDLPGLNDPGHPANTNAPYPGSGYPQDHPYGGEAQGQPYGMPQQEGYQSQPYYPPYVDEGHYYNGEYPSDGYYYEGDSASGNYYYDGRDCYTNERPCY